MSKPIVVIACMLSSSESWEPQTAPTSLALACRWRSRPQHHEQYSASLNDEPLWQRWFHCPEIRSQSVSIIGTDFLIPLESHERHESAIRSDAISDCVF